jgi:conjugal transfer pilus assembly protein TraI
MRLNPAVRDALSSIVTTLNADRGQAQCGTIAEGVFVPLEMFEQRGVPAAAALRALADVRLLVTAGRPAKNAPTLAREFNGRSTIGLVIHRSAIAGLDPDDSAVAPQREA